MKYNGRDVNSLDYVDQCNFVNQLGDDLSSNGWEGLPHEIVNMWESEVVRLGDDLPAWYAHSDHMHLVESVAEAQASGILDDIKDELYGDGTGAHGYITVREGGKTESGLDYNPCLVEWVGLEEDMAAYRYTSDEEDEPWEVGDIQALVDYWVEWVWQAEDTKEWVKPIDQ